VKAVPYLRVSTDDRGQRPERQMTVIEPWAAREGVELLPAVVDEGTSAFKTDPFERPAFLKACEAAAAAGAGAVVVEVPDRFARQDSDEYGWAKVELRRRYGLELLAATQTVEFQRTGFGRLMGHMEAEKAHGWVTEHARKVRSGMASKRATGAHMGRPPKPLSASEAALARALQAQGWGFRRIAHELSRRRGAFDVADRRLQAQRRIGATTVRDALREKSDRAESPSGQGTEGRARKGSPLRAGSEVGNNPTFDQTDDKAEGAGGRTNGV